MGAETTMWVEVEVSRKEWRKTYGVTSQDALENVDLSVGERTTGRVKGAYEMEGQDDEY